MKIKSLNYLFIVFALTSLFASCDDDDNVSAFSVDQTVFTDNAGLTLTYSGAPLLGKQVEYQPVANTNKARLVISGTPFALDDMPSLPGCGIIPGESTTTLDVDLDIKGDAATFKGTTKQGASTIDYEGFVSADDLDLHINVTLPENELTGKTFYLYKPEKMNTDFDPLILDWSYNESLGFDYDGDGKDDVTENHAFNLFASMMTIPMIGEYSVRDFLYGVLSSVTFLPDGNIQARYKDVPTDANFQSSPINLATYQFVEKGKIKLFLNTTMIDFVSSMPKSKASRADDILMNALTKLMVLVSDCMANGINVNYGVNEKGFMEVYLDDATVSRPLFEILIPVLQEPTVLSVLEKLVKENLPPGTIIAGMPVTPDLAWMLVSNFCKQTPTYFENTNYLKLGMVFTETPEGTTKK